MNDFDYIICGAGCAGLTFLYEILQYEELNSRRILIIDKSSKNDNDRTWCFWQKENNLFEQLVKHQWQLLSFTSSQFKKQFSITPYQYKIIEGLSFYNHILNYSKKFNNVVFVEEDIIEILNKQNETVVVTNKSEYTSNYVFNSIVLNKDVLKTKNSLLQHFKGIVIETNEDFFNPAEATFMDFSVSQHNGATFMYVLPTSKNIALIEYTLFTKSVLNSNVYDEELKNYITNNLKITTYNILHQEAGIIPMTDYEFYTHNGNIINIGTAAGCVKPSSGFTFRYIQKHTKKIVALLLANKKPYIKKSFSDKKFLFYDKVLLQVVAQNKMKGDEIFAAIFKNNQPQTVLKFLDNETNFFEDLKIMSSVPVKIFLPVALKLLLQRK